jgi:hypothetical protein
MPEQEKNSLLADLNKKLDAYNQKNKGKRKLFLDALGGVGGVGAIAGMAGGAALAMGGETMERLELERLEGEMRSMKFKMMMEMGNRSEEVSNLEVKVIYLFT